MLWHIELKFCTWLCFNVLQSKFECCHFASIFEGVLLLCELGISLWDVELKFCTWLVLMYYRSSSSVVTLQPSVSLSVHHFSELASNMHWQLSWNFKFDFGFFNAFFFLEKRYIKKPFKMFMTGVLCTVCGAQVYFSQFYYNISVTANNKSYSKIKLRT